MTIYEFLPTPPVETATDPIGSPADLRQRWRALVEPLGFGERLLRFVFVGPDRRIIKALSEVPVAKRASPGLVRDLMTALHGIVAEDQLAVAFLLTRPGRGGPTADDKQWSTLLTRAAAEFGVPIEPVFMANDERLVAVQPARQVR
ncbi:hypothetical protein [Mycobacterium sp. AT1]|uniref:hypothetical protein n=1 Tax=Mycobacterium sp. AT1 TaxID=1961706 RepID=UPI0009ADC991|nr:hypothetical protein [Mycobacterium sp. AT1]OPX11192.1 hypothetical protein B1790_08795 [Mycobacterium sp. AT1]